MARIFNLLHSHHADEIISAIFIQLNNHRGVLVCSEVCKLWRKIANQDSIWKDLFLRLWSDKVFVPNSVRSLLDTSRSKQAFIESLRDSKRSSITVEELTSINFYFRFKRVAGSYWTEKDPFWTTNEPLLIKFRSDGLVTGFPWDGSQMKWHFVDSDGRASGQSGSALRVVINS